MATIRANPTALPTTTPAMAPADMWLPDAAAVLGEVEVALVMGELEAASTSLDWNMS